MSTIEALKKEVSVAFSDEEYVSELTDIICRNLIKSMKKAVKNEIEELGRWILKNKGKLVTGGIALTVLIKIIRKGK